MSFFAIDELEKEKLTEMSNNTKLGLELYYEYV